MAGPDRWRDGVVGVLSALLAAGAVALVTGPLHEAHAAVPGHELPWWLLVPLFTAAELLVVHVQVRRESVSISFAEVPLVLGLAFCDPAGYVAASVLGSAAGLLYHRQFGLKLPFNLSLFALEAALAQTLYHLLLGAGDATGARGFAAGLATIVTTQVVSAAVLTAVIFVKVGEHDPGVLRDAVTSALVGTVANCSVGLLVVVLVVTRPGALALLGVVIAVLILAYRGYANLRRGHARLESLYRFTDRLGGAVRIDRVTEAVLDEARDVLCAGTAELVLLATPTAPATRLRLTGGRLEPVADGGAAQWWTPAVEGTPVLLTRRSTPAGDEPRDGMAAPLRVEDAVVGALLVTDRPYHLDTFSDADLRLFASLANHASLSLHKAQLVDRLAAEAAAQEHRSLHDPLTGLPNRRHFLRLLRARLAAEPATAVAMLDLVGFTDVNEALGHDTGDLLLAEVGRRLVASLGQGSVARLGNDEFAVVLPRGTGADDASARVAELAAATSGSFAVRDLTVDVRISAGVALGPEHGEDAATLLQHADTALYTAKQLHRDVEVYDVATDRAGQRVRMTGHLRDAIAAGDLEVHYQPKVDPRTGRATGAEALVRWTHPEHGAVSPEEFIPLAEHTGLIRALTTQVLDVALAACAGWRRDGHELGVAVNLSTRSLGDTELPQQVERALRRAGLPPGALTLEITETAVMQDLGRSVAVLERLRALGVRLSVDDFGTGQASLAYLKRLPVHEMKIDRSFVMSMTEDAGDAAIVRASVELGHALGLSVVAEGVEDLATLAVLAELRCDRAQGYLISRPCGPAEFRTWLRGQSAATDRTAVPAIVEPPVLAG
jgi:diguanylate cyclase (GGDEF)-like protein